MWAASALSSTTSTLRLTRGGAAATLSSATGSTCGRGSAAGTRTTISLPRRGPSLCASTRPPCMATRLFTSVRPMPSPPCDRSSERSPCTKRSKTRGKSSAEIPSPSSRTRITTSPPSSSAVSWMWPPGSVYLAALSSRFTSTCSKRIGSTWISTGSGGIETVSW